MKNKLHFVLIICLLFSINLSAQDYRLNLANRFFENTFYADAIPLYENLADKSPKVMLNLADSYTYTFQLIKAEKWYNKMARNYPQYMDEEYAFRYVQVLKALEKAEEEAKINYKFLIQNPEEKLAFKRDSAYLERVKSVGNRYEIKNMPFNSPYSEFGATVYRNHLIFAGSRKNTGLFSKMFRWDNLPYLDLYSVPVSAKNEEPKLLSEELTTRFHESGAVFSTDGKTMYFTRNNFMGGNIATDSAQVNNLKIYKAELKNGKWTNVTSLPFNSDDYSVEHPALSPDGKILYFSSNMQGGYGSFDLYIVSTADFKNPMNLGPEINTKHKEQFPFVDAEGNLYFSSDGHPGFGFLDVFISKISSENTFEKPENVGFPVNSGYDDFAFSIDYKTKNGFVSSNRPGGKGNDDIYAIHETKPLRIPKCFQIITGIVVDKETQEPLAFSKVQLQNTSISDSIIVPENAQYSFKAECGTTYILTAAKENYLADTLKITTDFNLEKKIESTLELSASPKVKTQEFDKKRKKQLLSLENDLVEKNDRFLIKTAPIHFDYDLWNIRKDAALILDKVIAILKKHPEVEIEIGAHTDVRGSRNYNQELSAKRAASVRQYLIKNGIDAARLTSKGYGESKPLIKCVPENSCTEKQHETNRRCEFVITKW